MRHEIKASGPADLGMTSYLRRCFWRQSRTSNIESSAIVEELPTVTIAHGWKEHTMFLRGEGKKTISIHGPLRRAFLEQAHMGWVQSAERRLVDAAPIFVIVLDLDKNRRHGVARKVALLETERQDNVDITGILILDAQYHRAARDERRTPKDNRH